MPVTGLLLLRAGPVRMAACGVLGQQVWEATQEAGDRDMLVILLSTSSVSARKRLSCTRVSGSRLEVIVLPGYKRGGDGQNTPGTHWVERGRDAAKQRTGHVAQLSGRRAKVDIPCMKTS